MEKGYLNIEELSEYLGIKKSSLYAKVAKRQVPFYKIDRLIRFKKTEIDRWVRA
ncbi:MAG: helix-turn-helix domain-containing protein [Nitrospirota bacterium]